MEKETEKKKQINIMTAFYNSRSGRTLHLFAEGVTQTMVVRGSTPHNVVYTFCRFGERAVSTFRMNGFGTGGPLC